MLFGIKHVMDGYAFSVLAGQGPPGEERILWIGRRKHPQAKRYIKNDTRP